MQLCRQVGNQLLHHLQDKRVLEHLEIVQRQQAAALQAQEIVDQGDADGFSGRDLTGAQDAGNLRSQAWLYSLQCGDQVMEKATGIVIRRLEREPGDRHFQAIQPLADTGSLAETCRRRDQSERPSSRQTVVQSLDELRS